MFGHTVQSGSVLTNMLSFTSHPFMKHFSQTLVLTEHTFMLVYRSGRDSRTVRATSTESSTAAGERGHCFCSGAQDHWPAQQVCVLLHVSASLSDVITLFLLCSS